jgi:translation initiation factor IF-1
MRRFAKRCRRDSSGTRMRADCGQHLGGAEVNSWRVMKEATASFLGTVTEAVRGDFFRVALDSGHSVLAKPAGKLQVHHIRLAIGDRVKVEISPYNPERGRIIQRL